MSTRPVHNQNFQITLLALIVLSSLILSVVATSFDFARATAHSISLHGHSHDDHPCADLLAQSNQLSCSTESDESHREHGFCQTIIALQLPMVWQHEPVAAPVRPGEFALNQLSPKMADGGPGEPPECYFG